MRSGDGGSPRRHRTPRAVGLKDSGSGWEAPEHQPSPPMSPRPRRLSPSGSWDDQPRDSPRRGRGDGRRRWRVAAEASDASGGRVEGLGLGGESSGSRACRRLHRFCPQRLHGPCRRSRRLGVVREHPWAGCAGGRCRWGATREGPPTSLACTSGNAAHGELVFKISKAIVVPAFARLSSISFTLYAQSPPPRRPRPRSPPQRPRPPPPRPRPPRPRPPRLPPPRPPPPAFFFAAFAMLLGPCIEQSSCLQCMPHNM